MQCINTSDLPLFKVCLGIYIMVTYSFRVTTANVSTYGVMVKRIGGLDWIDSSRSTINIVVYHFENP